MKKKAELLARLMKINNELNALQASHQQDIQKAEKLLKKVTKLERDIKVHFNV